MTTLKSEGFFRATKTTLLKARKATIEELQSVHDLKYIEFIRDTSKKGITNLPRSTYICPGTWDAALYAAGGALMAGEIVESQVVKSSSGRVVSPLETTRPLDHSTNIRRCLCADPSARSSCHGRYVRGVLHIQQFGHPG